jgi:hypothetical protein
MSVSSARLLFRIRASFSIAFVLGLICRRRIEGDIILRLRRKVLV